MKIVSTILSILDGVSSNALEHAERTSAATQILASLEYISRPMDRKRGGLNNWEYVQYQVPTKKRAVRNLRDFVAKEPVYRALHIGRIGAALVLVSNSKNNAVRSVANFYMVASTAVLYPIQLNGTDGSDQVSFLVHSAAGLGRAGASDRSLQAASDFIGAQTVLSYFAGGLTKLPGEAWRSGTAVTKIMGTETYGDPAVYKLLLKRPTLGRVASRGAMIWEVSFPLMLIERHAALLALFSGVGFHLFNARFMGLWRFLLTFVGTYPAVWALRR